MITISINSLCIRCAVCDCSGREFTTRHYLISSTITGWYLQTRPCSYLRITYLQSMFIIYPASGGINTHIQVGIDGLHKCRTRIGTLSLEVAEQTNTVWMSKVPSYRGCHVTKV